MREILTREELTTALKRNIPIEVTCYNGPSCCVNGFLYHNIITDEYLLNEEDSIFLNTEELEERWCITSGDYEEGFRFFTETPVHSLILKRKQL